MALNQENFQRLLTSPQFAAGLISPSILLLFVYGGQYRVLWMDTVTRRLLGNLFLSVWLFSSLWLGGVGRGLEHISFGKWLDRSLILRPPSLSNLPRSLTHSLIRSLFSSPARSLTHSIPPSLPPTGRVIQRGREAGIAH